MLDADIDDIGFARGCSGRRCTPRVRKKFGAEFMGVTCNCNPRERECTHWEVRSPIFYWEGPACNFEGIS